jgi:hypothetical protein
MNSAASVAPRYVPLADLPTTPYNTPLLRVAGHVHRVYEAESGRSSGRPWRFQKIDLIDAASKTRVQVMLSDIEERDELGPQHIGHAMEIFAKPGADRSLLWEEEAQDGRPLNRGRVKARHNTRKVLSAPTAGAGEPDNTAFLPLGDNVSPSPAPARPPVARVLSVAVASAPTRSTVTPSLPELGALFADCWTEALRIQAQIAAVTPGPVVTANEISLALFDAAARLGVVSRASPPAEASPYADRPNLGSIAAHLADHPDEIAGLNNWLHAMKVIPAEADWQQLTEEQAGSARMLLHSGVLKAPRAA